MKNKGFLVPALVIIIAMLGVGWWMSLHKNTPSDTEPTSAQSPVADENTLSTPKYPDSAPVVQTEIKSVSKTANLGDLFFDYPSDVYIIEDRGVTSDGLKQISLNTKSSTQEETVYISTRNIKPDMEAHLTEASLRSDSVEGGVVFKKINSNGLTIYQRTTGFEMNDYVLQYTIVYKGNLYTFIVTPAKPKSKIAELEVNRKGFETILNSIRVNK